MKKPINKSSQDKPDGLSEDSVDLDEFYDFDELDELEVKRKNPMYDLFYIFLSADVREFPLLEEEVESLIKNGAIMKTEIAVERLDRLIEHIGNLEDEEPEDDEGGGQP